MKANKHIPVVLTIAGSDSGGGAGIQADLKTFAALKVFGASAVTAITAQNPRRITAVMPVNAAMVRRQIEAVCAYFPVAAVKTGMLGDEKIVRAVADEIERRKFPVVVVDPVCRATSGRALLTRPAFTALCGKLLPLATVITPNLPEAEMLLRRSITGPESQRAAAVELSRRFKTTCIVKGGHLPGDAAIDVLCHKNRLYAFSARKLDLKIHGTGCVFSAALAAFLARGIDMKNAVINAKKCVFQLINNKKKLRIA
jgi:hydroxymethylpyrimidine kinase/phosphomethylpyrimidine kinase